MTDLAAPPSVVVPPAPPAARGSLLRSELRRFRSRRFIQILLLLALLGYALAIGLASTKAFSKTTPDQLAAAQRNVAEIVAEQNRFREQCLANPGVFSQSAPADVSVEEVCGPPATAEAFPVEQFLDKQPFVLAGELPSGAVAIAVLVAALSFLLGATYVGAEWSSRSMVALLFWEPRRLKVMRVKLGVLVGACALLGLISQVMWWGTAVVMARTLGRTGTLPKDFYPDLLGQQGRSIALAVFAGLLGFGIANLVRNTGAALGVGFVYFAVVENAVRGFRPSWQEWLLTDNAAALLLNGGHKIYLFNEGYVDERGAYIDSGREVLLSNLHGTAVLAGVTAVLVIVGVVLFQRRDLH